MKTPQIRSEITEEWVQYMLNDFENRSIPGSKVTLLSWEMDDATKKGDNYRGDLGKMVAKGMVQREGEEKHEKEYNHILKFQNPDAFAQEYGKQIGMTGNEMTIYTTIIPELNKFQAELSDNQFPIHIPPHIYSRNAEKEHVLVMENMKVHGYGNSPKEEGLEFEDAKIAIEQLARLHGVSYAYDKKHNFLKKYPTYDFSKMLFMFLNGIDVLIDSIIEFLSSQNEHKDLLHKVKESKPYTFKRMTEAFNKRNTQVFCLNHGDPWTNNILIKQNGDAKDDKILLVDWEIAHWNTLAYDLNYFFGGSLVPDSRKQYQDDLLQHYYSHFMKVTSVLGSPVPDWGFEQFQEEFLAVQPWGFSKNLTFTMILSEASKEWKLADHSAKPGKFKKSMAKVLVPIMLKPSIIKLMTKGMWKKFLTPILKELKTNKNELLNERFMACILEAEKNGIFDIPLTKS